MAEKDSGSPSGKRAKAAVSANADSVDETEGFFTTEESANVRVSASGKRRPRRRNNKKGGAGREGEGEGGKKERAKKRKKGTQIEVNAVMNSSRGLRLRAAASLLTAAATQGRIKVRRPKKKGEGERRWGGEREKKGR
jgi:hypothetical protein